MKFVIEVETPRQQDAIVVAKGLARLAKLHRTGVPVEVRINSRAVPLTALQPRA